MSYRVKELFYTLQGEGQQSGRPAVFLRFAGCNLWSGYEADRDRGPSCSRWCDTDFVGTDGLGGGLFVSARDIVRAIIALWPTGQTDPFVVCTGGEPLLQLDEPLIHALHSEGCIIAVETNGTLAVPPGIDWLCVSPKANTRVVVQQGDELKLVFPQTGLDPEFFCGWDFRHFFLQPCDGPNLADNIRATVQYCLAHPHWRLSLQTHKLLGIP